MESRKTMTDYRIQGATGEWEVVIGLEVHAQVTSNAKLFSGASTAFGAEPNTQVSLIDAAMPGMLPVPNRESACAEKIFVWLGLASSWIDADFYGILDDDTFVHLERVAADLRAHAGSSRLFYGQFSWADAWDARKARHHGYNNQQNQVLASAARHLRRQRDRSEAALAEAEGAPAARNGPFPLPLGFLMILGASLARAVGGSAGATALGAYLRSADAEGRRQHAPPCGAQ